MVSDTSRPMRSWRPWSFENFDEHGHYENHGLQPYLHDCEELKGIGGQPLKAVGTILINWFDPQDLRHSPKVHLTDFLVLDHRIGNRSFDSLIGYYTVLDLHPDLASIFRQYSPESK